MEEKVNKGKLLSFLLGLIIGNKVIPIMVHITYILIIGGLVMKIYFIK